MALVGKLGQTAFVLGALAFGILITVRDKHRDDPRFRAACGWAAAGVFLGGGFGLLGMIWE